MGNFCTQCGRPLQEGEVCNCTAQAAPNPAPAAPTPTPVAPNPHWQQHPFAVSYACH